MSLSKCVRCLLSHSIKLDNDLRVVFNPMAVLKAVESETGRFF